MRKPLCRTAVLCDLSLHSITAYAMLKCRASMTRSDFIMQFVK